MTPLATPALNRYTLTSSKANFLLTSFLNLILFIISFDKCVFFLAEAPDDPMTIIAIETLAEQLSALAPGSDAEGMLLKTSREDDQYW